MDKFSVYVIASYVVTFVVLFAYLGWLWWRLRQEQAAQAQSAQMPSAQMPPVRAVQEQREQGRR